jgi:hypothetical protein
LVLFLKKNPLLAFSLSAAGGSVRPGLEISALVRYRGSAKAPAAAPFKEEVHAKPPHRQERFYEPFGQFDD